MSVELDKNGKIVTSVTVETRADAIEERLHQMRRYTKAMLAAWQAGDRFAVCSLYCAMKKVSDEMVRLLVAMANEEANAESKDRAS